jgi:hypothetical protein
MKVRMRGARPQSSGVGVSRRRLSVATAGVAGAAAVYVAGAPGAALAQQPAGEGDQGGAQRRP